MESHCIPILTYGIEVIHVADQDTRRQLRVAYNSVFRRIFSYRPWQSVRELQSFLARLTWEELQSGSFPHQQLQLATGLEVEDCVAELDVSEAGAVALNDLVTRSQADFSGKATCLCRLDEDAGLLDRTLEVSNS